MQSISATPLPSRYYPIPIHLQFHHSNLSNRNTFQYSSHKTQTRFRSLSALTFCQTHSCRKQQQQQEAFKNKKSDSDPFHNHTFLLQFQFSIGTNNPNNGNPEDQNGGQGQRDCETKRTNKALFANMWWAELKAALGQRFNFGAIVCAAGVVTKDRHLALPHVAVPDIRYIDWVELRRRGFQGVVFDKDNTITAPYSLTLWGPLASSLDECKSVFGPNVAVFSNSAGLYEYDHDGSRARTLEGAIGIKVIRHRVKKPAGSAEEIEKHFGCESWQLIMVGDRPLTDIVYGNQNGFLTILTAPLSLAGEPFIVRQVRKLEAALVKCWSRRGLKPSSHRFLPDPTQCVIDPPNT